MRKNRHIPEILLIILFGVMIIIAARVSYGFGTKVPPVPKPSPSPIPETRYVEYVANSYYATPQERVKIDTAAALVNKLKNGKCVHSFLKNRKMIQTGGRTPLQVAEDIRSFTGTVPVKMYYRAEGLAIAYRNVGSPTIHFNRRAFTQKTPLCTWVSTMFHETAHSLGEYGHDMNWSPSREFSVPYSINHAVTECCNETNNKD